MKRVAFFISGNTSLSTFIMQLAEGLVSRGLGVDLFYTPTQTMLLDRDRAPLPPNLRVFRLRSPFAEVSGRQQLSQFLQHTRCEIKELAANVRYSALVGVEKTGLAIAFLLSKEWSTPLLYWSLELYDMRHPSMSRFPCLKDLLELERLAHRACVATIVQDADRADALASITGHDSRRIYLPVTSSESETITEKKTMLHDILELSPEEKILLQYGNNRMSAEKIMAIADSLPAGWSFVLHGLFLSQFAGVRYPRLHFSGTRIAEKDLPALISSADAGLVHYENIHINDALIARSLEKVARYLGAGLPIIAHDLGNFSSVFADSGAALLYSDAAQVGRAVEKIDKNPDFFRMAALRKRKEYLFEYAGGVALDFFCAL